MERHTAEKQDNQWTYITEALSRNRCKISMYKPTQSECVFVSLGTQREMCTRHIVFCGLPGFTIFVHIIS